MESLSQNANGSVSPIGGPEMKEIFQLLVMYNIQANHDLIGILNKTPADKVTQDVGAYYKSILGILNHVLLSNIYWIRRLAKYLPELEPILQEIPNVQPQTPRDIVWDTLEKLKPVLSAVDAQIERLVSMLPDQRLTEEVKYTSTKGGERSIVVWHILIHLFNHHTHNRGQIAVLLDQMGIDNDYSSILWRNF